MRAISLIVAGAGASLALAACGSGGATQASHEPRGRFQVQVVQASFPSAQRVTEHTHLVIAVRNAGRRTLPDVAISICNVTCSGRPAPGEGTSERAFAAASDIPGFDPTNPQWVVDRPPGACGYSCRNGGKGSGASAYANTWALGRLRPGAVKTFDWTVTAVSPGRHVLAWVVSAGLNGRARAVLPGGGQPAGIFTVSVGSASAQQYVNNNGKIVNQ